MTAFRLALHAEWTKLRTVSGTAWLLAAAVALTIGLSAASSTSVTCDGVGCGQDVAKVGLLGVMAGQAAVAVLAVLAIGNEYGTGMIRVTFAAMPRRTTVLAAKAVVVSVLTAAAGTVAVAVSAAISAETQSSHGFTAAHGYHGLPLRPVIGTILYLVLIALLSLGIAALVRDSAAAIGIVLALLYLFSIVAMVVTNPDWHRHVRQIGPMEAGLDVQNTIDLHSQPLSPWQGLGVLAIWAFGALLVGGASVRLRDA